MCTVVRKVEPGTGQRLCGWGSAGAWRRLRTEEKGGRADHNAHSEARHRVVEVEARRRRRKKRTWGAG